MNLFDRINETAAFIKERIDETPDVAIVLGTGLGSFTTEIDVKSELAYSEIPNFPISTVSGHDGKLLIGSLQGKRVIAMKGRFHYYEGYSMEQIAFPIRVLKQLGVKTLLLSNASGGVNPDFSIGDIMVIEDHINLFPSNPLIGATDESMGPRFPDMSEPYSRALINLLNQSAEDQKVSLKKGVYAGVTGPCYETPAEYKYLRIIGADTVGMSTVPETITANHLGMRVAALSVITDLGVEGKIEKISHEEVTAAAEAAEPKMAAVVKSFLSKL